jgi:glyoxylase-like metal-dependent hydrolase (beta-lactamase superfamily II)
MSVSVVVLHACNPGPMTGAGNHTYLLAARGEAVLIDAGVGHPDHLAAIAAALAQNEAALTAVIVTHNHPDHAAGAPLISAAYPRTTFAKYPWPGDAASIRWRPLADGDEVRVGDDAVTALYTPGHAPDHLALWHGTTRTMFTGDLVIAGSSVMIEASRGGSLVQYLRSLDRILELEPRRLLPAHGPAIDEPAAVVRGYVEHRRKRERQIVAAIAAGQRTVEAIAESIYDGLEPRLMPAAQENVRAHLEKLASEGVAANKDGWRLLDNRRSPGAD